MEEEVVFVDKPPADTPANMLDMKQRKPDSEPTPALRVASSAVRKCDNLHAYVRLLSNNRLGFLSGGKIHELRESTTKALFKQGAVFTTEFLNTYGHTKSTLLTVAEEIACANTDCQYCESTHVWKTTSPAEASHAKKRKKTEAPPAEDDDDEEEEEEEEVVVMEDDEEAAQAVDDHPQAESAEVCSVPDKTPTTNALLHNSRHGFDPGFAAVDVSTTPPETTNTAPATRPPEHLIPNLANLVKPATHRSLAYLGAKLNLRYGTEEFTNSVDRLVFRTFPPSSLNQQQLFALLLTGFSCKQTGGDLHEALCALSEETTHGDLQRDLALFFLKSISKTKVDKWSREELWTYIRCCYLHPDVVEATLPYKNTVASAMDWLFKEDKTVKLQAYKQIWAASVYSVLNQRHGEANNDRSGSAGV